MMCGALAGSCWESEMAALLMVEAPTKEPIDGRFWIGTNHVSGFKHCQQGMQHEEMRYHINHIFTSIQFMNPRFFFIRTSKGHLGELFGLQSVSVPPLRSTASEDIHGFSAFFGFFTRLTRFSLKDLFFFVFLPGALHLVFRTHHRPQARPPQGARTHRALRRQGGVRRGRCCPGERQPGGEPWLRRQGG